MQKISISRRLSLICSAVLVSFLLVQAASGDNRRDDRDFGAETIEPVDTRREPIKPLPVELVEEPEYEEPIPTGKKPGKEEPEEGLGGQPDESIDLGAKTTILNVTDGEISALIKTFSKLTKRNYIVDSNVKGKITIHFPSEVTLEEALRIFESVLLLKGFTTVPVADNVWKIIPAKDAKQTTIPTIKDGKEVSDVLVTELVRLKHIPAQDMQQLLTQFVSKDGSISAVPATNSLIIIDAAANIKRLKDLAAQLDVPAVDQEITIIPIIYADASDIADKINEILGEDKEQGQGQRGTALSPSAPQPIAQTPGAAPIQRPLASGVKTGEGRRMLPLKIIPDERTNSLIVVADPELTLKVRAVAEQLDSEVDRSGGGFFVYRLKHADAEELADILSSLTGGGGTSTTRSRGEGSSISRSQERLRNSSRLFGGRDSSLLGDTRQTGSSNRLSGRGSRRAGTSAGTSNRTDVEGRVNFEGDVSIAADTSTNSLIINASRTDYQRLKEVIEALDVKRRQVLVEATILEVSLNKRQGMGVELQGTAGVEHGGIVGQTNFGGISNLLSNPAALSDLTIAAASTGTLTLPGGLVIPSQAMLISAVSTNENVNVLSTPTILATDNEEAEIVVGENVPFVTSTSTNETNLSNTFNQIERQDVGIKLTITPQISSGDFVVLKIFVEISNVVEGTENSANGPTTTIRTTETQVEVKDGQMVVTGGLIQDTVNDSSRGVPFFEDIPVIGQLLKKTGETRRRTNLLIFITPRIVEDQFEAREQTREAADQMTGEIYHREIEPDRREVLENKNMDKVVETLPKPPALPTTITPPKMTNMPEVQAEDKKDAEDAAKRTLERLNGLSHTGTTSTAPASTGTEEAPINIAVAPRLPEVPGDNAEPGDYPVKSARLEGGTKEQPAKASTYVVLRQVNAKSGAGTPFTYVDNERTIGVIVPSRTASLAGRFFEVGRRYRFRSASGLLEFVCLGVYGSSVEASAIQPALAKPDAWYKLSPEETFSLGRKSWIKGQ